MAPCVAMYDTWVLKSNAYHGRSHANRGPVETRSIGKPFRRHRQQLRIPSIGRSFQGIETPKVSSDQLVSEDQRTSSSLGIWQPSAGGRWKVRPIRPEEISEVAELQARAFHEANWWKILEDIRYYVFRGEVLAGLQQKLKYSRDEGFCCLVAQASTGIVGVVEVSIQGDQPELRALKSKGFMDDSYAYVACMAVDDDWRRQGVASDLLAHAEKMAGRWMLTWVLLHVHVDNVAGIQLYQRNGYTVIAEDPVWKPWFFGRRRQLMAKTSSCFVPSAIQSISTNILRALQQQGAP